MTQSEQENDPGRCGGEVDEATPDEAWHGSDRRHDQADADPEREEREGADEQPQPWAKTSASTESLAADDE